MSRPIYNGGLTAALDANGRPYVHDDGNWSTQDGAVPGYRAWALYVNGTLVWGYYPTVQREDFAQAQAHFPNNDCTRATCLAWLGPRLWVGDTFEIRMKAGFGPSYDQGVAYMEWGSAPATSPTSPDALATTGMILVEAPPPPNVTVSAADAWGWFSASSLGATDIAQWRKANKGESDRYDAGVNDPAQYATLFGKFMAGMRALRQA